MENLKHIIFKSLKLDLEAQEIPGWHLRLVRSGAGDVGAYWTETVLDAFPSKPILFYKSSATAPWGAFMRLEDINPAYCLYNESVIVTFNTAIMVIREDIWRPAPTRGH